MKPFKQIIDESIENVFKKVLGDSHERASSVNNYIPIEFIKDGIVKLKYDNEYRAVMKISPINFFTKSEAEKDSILNSFSVFLNQLEEPIQIICQSRIINMDDNIQMLKDCYATANNDDIKQYINIYGNLIYKLTQDSSILAKDFYIVITHKPGEKDTFLDTKKIIGVKVKKFATSIESTGIQTVRLEDNELYQLYYAFYNKDKERTQPLTDKNISKYTTVAVSKRPDENNTATEDFGFNVKSKKDGYHGNANLGEMKDSPILDDGIITVDDIIAADDIIMENDYIKINGRYIRTIYVSGISADVAYTEWLSEIYSYPANLDISMHIFPFENKKIIDELTAKLAMELSDVMEAEGKGKLVNKSSESKISEIEHWRNLLTYGQRMFYLTFFVTITAGSLEELNDLTLDIETLFGNKQILTRKGNLRQFDCFQSVLPIGVDYIAHYRNMPTDALATFFPFVSAELSSTKGKPILYGLNLLANSLVYFDRFNPPDSSITNYNSIVCGVAGSGKSFATKLEAMRRAVVGTKIMGIDPNGEYKPMTLRCGGQYIKVSASSRDRINIFEISYYEEEDGNPPNLLKSKIVNLHSIVNMMFEIAGEPYSAQYKNVIDRALKDCYGMYGITEDPASLFKDNKIRKGNMNLARNYMKEVPILSDLAKILVQNYGEVGNKIVHDVLDMFISGSFDIFNGKSTIDIDGSTIFFDIKDVEAALQPLVYLVLCEFIWEKAKIKPKKQNMLMIVDEAWKMMKQKTTAQFLAEFARQDRKFNVGLCCVTQQAKDFFKDPWGCGETIYANSTMHVLMKQNKEDIDVIAETYKISDNIKDSLVNTKSGYGYIFWGNVFTRIYFQADDKEFQIVNTNPNLV